MKLDPFYPIIDSSQWLERLLPLGIKLVQLRIKDKSNEQVNAEIKTAKQLCDAHNCQLIINDYWQLAIDNKCDFIHLGQEDLDDADILCLRKHNVKIGLSTHDKAELDRALKLNPNYIALGPIYPTILKKMKWHEQGVDRLTVWKKLIGTTPLVAIGGMSIERAKGAYEAGADIVSAVTDITLNKEPEIQTSKWLEATRSYQTK